MSPSKFNSLIYAGKLESAGVPKEQASIHALALADVLEIQTVSKGDLEAQEERVDARFERFEKKFMAELAALEKRLMAEMVGLEKRLMAEIVELEKRLMAEIVGMEKRLSVEIGEFRNDVIKWVAILSLSQIGVTSTIVALIVHAR